MSFYRTTVAFISLLILLLSSAVVPLSSVSAQVSPIPMNQRHPDAGTWVTWPSGNTAEQLKQPFIKGVAVSSSWDDLSTAQGVYNWSGFEARLDSVIGVSGKRAFIILVVGDACPGDEWPQWMRDRIASWKSTNFGNCHPLQFWDPLYIEYYKQYITALANFLANYDSTDTRPTETDVVYVRGQMNGYNQETVSTGTFAEWEWQDFNPAPNGHIHQVNLTSTIEENYRKEIVLWYRDELRRAYTAKGLRPAMVVAKAGDTWNGVRDIDLFASEGIIFDRHNASSNPAGFYFDMKLNVQSGITRGAAETAANPLPPSEGQYTYWEMLAYLHYGLEFPSFYGRNRGDEILQPDGPVNWPENREAMEFATRYAGYMRDPELSPGAWSALRGNYPIYQFGGTLYQSHWWGNYEFLLKQLNPQESVGLFGFAHNELNGLVNPNVSRNSATYNWTNDRTLCASQYPADECLNITNPPTIYIKQNGNAHLYGYPMTDLGLELTCGTNAFCTNATQATQSERFYWARQTQAVPMRFDLNSQFSQSLGGRATFRIVYLDRGTGTWQLRYDSTSGEKIALTVTKTNSNIWKEATVTVSDGRFTNANGDISLNNGGNDEDIFHMIEVQRAGSIPGDINNDGIVNNTDMRTVLNNVARTSATLQQGDTTNNGKVNMLDSVFVLTKL